MLTQTLETTVPAQAGKATFYRPQLDLLRLAAFLLVFVVHGPRLPGGVWWQDWFNQYALAGASGLCLFFLLSSYLITELLLREREQTGTLDLKKFYIRRTLRIWPLYYTGILLGVVFGLFYPDYRFHGKDLVRMLLLVGWMGEFLEHNPFGILWSISVEEAFYAVWPVLARRRWLVPASVLLIPISVTASAWVARSWFNPLVHFLYFATGAILALLLHRRSWNLSKRFVFLFLISGLAMALFAYSPYVTYWPLRYFLLDVECVLLFLGFLGIPEKAMVKRFTYLGQISYGLYVFHAAVLFFVEQLFMVVWQGRHHILAFVGTYLFSLLATAGLAHLSFRYWETPFLRLKKRYERVHSRGV